MPNENHTTHVDSRRQSDHPGHLDRASAKTRPAVNETRSRSRCGLPLGDLADDKTSNLTPEEFFALEH